MKYFGSAFIQSIHDQTISGGIMAEETAEQKLARLEAENRALKDQISQRKPGELRLKVSEKGGLSVYGLGRFRELKAKE
jgi:pyrroline-5-carboxylate reductase